MTNPLRIFICVGFICFNAGRCPAGELPTLNSFKNAFEQDCFFFAQNFCAALVHGKVSADDVLDMDSLFKRSQQHGSTEGFLPPGLEIKVMEAYRAQFGKQFPTNAVLRPIRVRREDKQARVTIRFIMPTGGFNYHDLLCERRFMVQPARNFIEPPRGYQAVQAVDIFDWLNGQYESDVLFRNGKLFQEEWQESGTKWEKWAKAMTELSRFRASEDWDGLLKSYRKLPPELQADKAIALLRCSAARHLGPQELLEALTFLQRNFPRHSSFEFVTLDVLLLQKKYDVALNVVDKIDERVGGDPYLEVIRAGLYNRSGKRDLARERAQQALHREPELARLLPPQLVALLKENVPVAPSARPATTQVAAASSPAAPRVISHKLRLQGVFLRAGRPSAIISGQTVYEGDAFEGMQITKIEKSRVTVQLATGELRSLTFD